MVFTQKQNQLLSRFNSTLLFKAVSIAKLPLAFITGLKIDECNGNECVTLLRLKTTITNYAENGFSSKSTNKENS